MWGMIATWRMAHDGVLAAKELLEGQASCKDAVETAIKAVEDYPFYKSVGLWRIAKRTRNRRNGCRFYGW